MQNQKFFRQLSYFLHQQFQNPTFLTGKETRPKRDGPQKWDMRRWNRYDGNQI